MKHFARLFLPLALLLTIALIPAACTAADPAFCPENTLTVSGSGEMMTTPDIAQVTVGVMTENADVRRAQQENSRIMDGMIASLLAARIPREDIQTTGYSIYPVYDENVRPFGQKVRFYQVQSMVQVTVRDISRAGEVIDIAVNNGANQVSSVTFSLSPEREQSIRGEVLTMAVRKARTDADVAASATGVTITGVKSVNVGQVYIPVAYDNRYSMAAEMKGGAGPTPIEPGQVRVTAQVSISYLIR